jgi:type I restriction enzyme S subunit
MGEVVTGKALAVNAPGKQRPYLRTKNVFDGRIDIEDVLTMPMTDEQFAQFRVRRDDVLLNEGQSLELVGRCSIYSDEYPDPCAMQNQLLRFRAREGVSSVFASYLFRRCQETGVFARIALQTTSIAHLGGSRFERLRLAWPKSENEQCAIATALRDADALLGALDRLIAKKRDLKQATMQQLLTCRTRPSGSHGEWKSRPLGSEIADLVAGVSVNSTDEEDGSRSDSPAVLKTSSVAAGKFIPSERKAIVRRDLGRARVSPRAGALIISRMNTLELVGECGYVPADFPNLFLPDRLWMTQFKYPSRTSGRWLSLVLSSPSLRRLLRNIATGTSGSMKNISKEAFLALEISWPQPEEQAEIAAVLSEMDSELEMLQARRDKTQALKQAMMQELLTGRTRLV